MRPPSLGSHGVARHELGVVVGQLAAADDARVATGVSDQLNSQWAPNQPAFTPESVASQRGPDKFGGWGGVRIGGVISVTLAKSMLAAPNNTLTPEEALALATQQVMDATGQGVGPGRAGRHGAEARGLDERHPAGSRRGVAIAEYRKEPQGARAGVRQGHREE